MNISLFVARRYLRAKHSFHFIGIISLISIGGNAIGVAAIIIVLAIFAGFSDLVESFLIGFDPHVRITQAQGGLLQSTNSLSPIVQRIEGVEAVSEVVTSKAVAFAKQGMQTLTLKGIAADQVEKVSGVGAAMVVGRLNLERTGNTFSVVIGAGVADNLRTITGDTLALLSPKGIEMAVARTVPPPRYKAVVRGIFESNNMEYDFDYVFTSIETARRLLGLRSHEAHSLDIRLSNFNNAETIAKKLRFSLGKDYRVETWFDLHRDLYSIMQFERLSAFVILSLIIVVAGFNVFASLSMSVMEKKPDLALLKAIGARPKVIGNIFRLQSVFIGCIGVTIGTLLGVLVVMGQQEYGWFALDATAYKISAIPVILEWQTVGITALFSLGVTFLAGFIPAKSAAAITPAAHLISERKA